MKRVYVGLSGGVDSSVAASLLKQSGCDVTGIYMKNWTQDLPGVKCPWKEDLADARAVAARLDIPFKMYDFQDQYRDKVVQYMIDEYEAGRTPNPDIMCNQEIKFKLFLDTALGDGADYVATGHYASIKDGRLTRGVDENKDQTYFLYRMPANSLDKVLFPIGNFTKPKVRQMASELGLPTANKKDSQGICFVGPVGMKAFLSQYLESGQGLIIDQNGNEVGMHDGAIFYTVGQRQGLGVGGGKPYYVTHKDMKTNTVYVTTDLADLEVSGKRIGIKNANWLGCAPQEGKSYKVRIRHRGELIDCAYYGDHLVLEKPVRAVASGQGAVLYDGKTCIGGADIIASVATIAK